MKINRRVAFVMLFSLAGAIGLYLYSSASMNGSLVEWESLSKPPGGTIQVIGPGFVQTGAGEVYQYTYKQNCINDCWVRSESPPADLEYFSLWKAVLTCLLWITLSTQWHFVNLGDPEYL